MGGGDNEIVHFFSAVPVTAVICLGSEKFSLWLMPTTYVFWKLYTVEMKETFSYIPT